MARRITCTYEEAQELARTSNRVIAFQDIDDDGALIFHGVAHPCGCVTLNTILSDNTIGWGSWTAEYCGVTECAEAVPLSL